MKKSLIIWVFALLLVPAALFAQEQEKAKYRFGLTFPEIGVIWHISDNIAFVPGVNFGHTWGRNTISFYDDTLGFSSSRLEFNAGLRFFISEWKDLRFYISPKYGFAWHDSDIDDSSPLNDESSIKYHRVSGAWGLQYAINDRVSIFGDIGATYERVPEILSLGDSNTISTEGTWGLILYIK